LNDLPPGGPRPETDLQYFQRRAAEERAAAAAAPTAAEREQHLKLARLYAQVADIYRQDGLEGTMRD
jgi:hypothetical protein